MPRTCPAPPCNAGFTFVEVLVALGLAVLLISVTAATLSTTLRAERALDYREHGHRIAASLQAELYLTGAASNTAAQTSEHWLLTETRMQNGPATGRVYWSVWEISPRARPASAVRIAMLAEPPAE